MARQDLAYAITVNDAQLRLATQHVAAFNAELQASTVTGRKVDEQFRAFGRRTVQTGHFFTRSITLPVVLAGIAAGKMAADFQKSLAKISGITNTTAADTERLKQAMLDLGGSTIITNFSDLADAAFELQSVGFHTGQTIKALGPIAKASAAGLGSIRDVADAVASSLDAYGIAGQNAGKNTLTANQAIGVLIGTVNAGKLHTDELAGAIGRIIPLANALDISFDQVGASIASMSRQGLNANLAVTGLRALFSQLARAQPSTQKALASVGTSPAAVLKALKDQRFGVLPTLVKLREDFDKIGDKPINITPRLAAGALTGNATAIAKIRAQVGDTNQALSKLFPNIRALTAFLILTGTRRDQNATIFAALSHDIEHSQDVLKRAYEAKLRTPIGQLELQLTKLRTTATKSGDTFIKLGAHLLGFANGIVSGVQGIGHVLDKLGPVGDGLKTLAKNIGIGLVLFGPVTTLVGRAAQAASLGVLAWGRWQTAAIKAGYAVRGINIAEDEALIAHRKATLQFEQGFNQVTAAADRTAAAAGRVTAASGAGVRAGIAGASAGNAILSKTSGGKNLSRMAGTAASTDAALMGGASLAVIQRRAASEVAAAQTVVTGAVEKYEAAIATAIPNQINFAKAELDAAAAALTLAKNNETLLFPSDQKLLAMTKELTLAERELAIAQQQGVGIAMTASRVANLQTGIRERQALLAAPPTGFRSVDQRAKILQATKEAEAIAAAEAAALAKTQGPARIMATRFGTAVQGMQSTAKLGFDFIAFAFAANMVGKVITDSHHTKTAVTHDLIDIRKAGVGTAAALGAAALGIGVLSSRAGGMRGLGVALGESGIGAILLRNKLRLAIAALIGLQFTGVKTETIFNAAMVGMLARTVALRAGIFETGAAFGPWGIAIAAAATVILFETDRIKAGIKGVNDEVNNIVDKIPGGRKIKLGFVSGVVPFGPQLVTAVKAFEKLNKEEEKHGKHVKERTKEQKVDDELWKQLTHGLDMNNKVIASTVKLAEARRAAGKEGEAEQIIAAAQAKQLQMTADAAGKFLRAHGQDQLANLINPVTKQIKEAKHEFDTLFNNIENSVDNAFQARTDRILDGFDRATDNMLDNFDEQTQKLADKLRVKVKVGDHTFTIKVNGKTPAERELDALDKIQQKQNFRRDKFDARQQLGNALSIGDPNAIRDAQRKLEDAETEEKRFGLQKRADTERTAADAATKKAQDDFAKRRKRERQAIEDNRTEVRRNVEATRKVMEDNLQAALKHEADLFNSGKIGLSKYKSDVQGIMRSFNVSLEQAGKDGGKAYADQMKKYFGQLQTYITASTKKMGDDADALARRLRNISQGLQAIFAESRLAGSNKKGAAAAATAQTLGTNNPVALAKIAAGLPTRAAIIKAISSAGSIATPYLDDVPKSGRPSQSQYDAFLRKVRPTVRSMIRKNLRDQGFFGANTGAVVPGQGNQDTVPALLTPGEIVLNSQQQRNLGQMIGKPGASAHELFDAVHKPQRFKTGGVVLQKWIRRMHKEGRSDAAIRGQIHRWHPDWTEADILNTYDAAMAPRTTYPARSGTGAMARKAPGTSIDHAPMMRIEDLRTLRNAYNHSAGIRMIAALAGDPSGGRTLIQSLIRVIQKPGVGSGVGAALSSLALIPGLRGAKALREDGLFNTGYRGGMGGGRKQVENTLEKFEHAKVSQAHGGRAAVSFPGQHGGESTIYFADTEKAETFLEQMKRRSARVAQILGDERGSVAFGAARKELQVKSKLSSGRPFFVDSDMAEFLPKDDGFFYHGTSREAARQILKSGKLMATSSERAGGGSGPVGAWATKNPDLAKFWGKEIVVIPESAVGGSLKRHPLGIWSSPHDVGFLNKGYRGALGSKALSQREIQIFGEFEPKQELYPEDYARFRSKTFRGQAIESRALMAAADQRIRDAAKRLGLNVTDIRPGLGVWRGQKNIGYGIHVQVPKSGYTQEFENKVKALAAYTGKGFKQASLSFGRPVAPGSPGSHPGVFWKAGGRDIAEVQAKLDKAYGEGNVGLMHSPERHGYYVVNFGGVDAGKFDKTISKLGISGKSIGWQGSYVFDRRLGHYGMPGSKPASYNTALNKRGVRGHLPKEMLADHVEAAARAAGTLIGKDYVAPFDEQTALKRFRETIAAHSGEANWQVPKDIPGGPAGAMHRIYASAVEYAQYRRWYDAAGLVARHTAKREGVSTQKFVKALAYTSPSEDPTSNFNIAVAAIRAIKNEGKLTADTFAKHYNPSVSRTEGGAQGKYKFHESQMDKIAELFGVGPKVSKGKVPKLTNYFLGILEAADPRSYLRQAGRLSTTVDRHSTALVWPDHDAPGAAYNSIAEMYREVALQLGWAPKEVQAASWVPQKALNKAGRWGGDFRRFITSSADAYFKGFANQYGDDALQDLMKKIQRSSKYGVKGFWAGGTVPGSGRGDTVPAMLTPGEIVLNRDHQRSLASRLGMPGASPSSLFSSIAQRFADGGVVSEHGMRSSGLPTIPIPGLNDLAGALKKLVSLMAKAAIRSDQQAPGTAKLMQELALGGKLRKDGTLDRDSKAELAKLRRQLLPAHSTDLLRQAIPGFNKMSGDAKRIAEATVAQNLAHPVRAGLFTPHADGPDSIGGARTLRRGLEARAIQVNAFSGGGGEGMHVGQVTIIVEGENKSPKQIAREVANEFKHTATHTVRRRRGYEGRH